MTVLLSSLSVILAVGVVLGGVWLLLVCAYALFEVQR